VNDSFSYYFLANAVLALHVAIVLFVILGLVLIVLGNLLSWRWVNSLWFRVAHIATIGTVVAEAWFDVVCPLTTLEMWLREKAHVATYSGSFIEHWLQALLFWEAPPWVFATAYSLFGLAVAIVWWCFPPERNKEAK
jgi:hypothetical protein